MFAHSAREIMDFLVHARHGARYSTGQAFLLIALFWVTMNVLLWRAEYGARDEAGSVVPVGVVWQRILTAPDSSSLSVFQRGKKIGFCHWVTSVGEEFSQLDEAPPEGLAGKLGGYRIQLDGNATLGDFASRARPVE